MNRATRTKRTTQNEDEEQQVGEIKTILPGSANFHLERNRLIVGWESLRLQGWPIDDYVAAAKNFTNSQLNDLAGNAFNGHAYGAMFLATLIARSCLPEIQWNRQAEQDAEAQDMVDSLDDINQLTLE